MRFAIVVACMIGCTHAAQPPQATARGSLKVSKTLVHSPAAFTQGLAFWQGRLFEGTGMYGASMLRELDPQSGDELRHKEVSRQYFGEGITILDGRLYELTWREQRCLVYDVATFEKVGEIQYEGEGWGLANDGKSLITSDGSSTLAFRDPQTMKVQRTITVTLDGKPVTQLNELELVNGRIWANVWHTDEILRIVPSNGVVDEVIDTTIGLPHGFRPADPEAVLNGIAFDDQTGHFFVTGKDWPLLFDVTLQ